MAITKPTALEIRDELEGFPVDSSVVSDPWMERKRDNSIIPQIQSWTGMNIEGSQQFTELYSGNGGPILILNRKPVISVDKIEYVASFGSSSSVDINSVILDTGEGVLRSRVNVTQSNTRAIFPRGENNVQITYTAGFSEMPINIKEAIIYLVAHEALGLIANRTGGGDLSVKSHSRNYGGRGKFTHWRNELARKAMGLLRPYITGVVGAGG